MNTLKRALLTTALILTIAIPLTAAGTHEEVSISEIQPGGNPFTIIDCFDREVEIPATVERISCIYAFSAHVVTMLDRGEDIVSVVYGSKRDRLLNEINPYIQDAAIPSDDGVINIEELLNVDPDIILLKGETAMMPAEIEKLERFNLPYVIIDFNTIEEQMYAIELIGKVIGREEKAVAFNNYFQRQINFIESRVVDIPASERVRIYHSVNEASRTDAPNTLPAEWTELSGAYNVSVGSPLRFHDNKYYASLEQIYLWNADVIIANQEGVDEYIRSNEKWAGLKAVQDGRVYQIPIGISRWGHPGGMETPLAMLWTSKLLYPDRFSDLSIEDEARSFYETFFNHTVSDEMIAQIMSGKNMRLPKGEIRDLEK
ncbi:MAG: ABC transporter substrate-binding protein [Spirochaetales bacterium]|uniref:ABC transporter substrate-binding protein n=1 Tax=Candidatus Thalassospirochaeta sargassi TaxID=3119039 RepID=A0AAJ1IFZ4_9SPIO|nr:ABC transporter substrate-binding protein [Spirochaetales bacterium]